ncbi:carbohydrate ABC transporter permease [Bradyrhizobium tropiciagri]|uniref:carbohydrate ABC transporter permease n=1 Tax=Bradyrhizobium tropiciagri TaxID=312253 RepID=UPI001BACFEB4|nr:carbohydrate ABC transporter permease [Bradyrhizobium tropiciagri]MBR0900292.1 carbohydrate ABC transporter permease [Bradyrhizobium tropiciagri]
MSGQGLTGLSPWSRRLVALGVLAWCLITVFPLYWVVVTAFKTPPGVVGGPTYIPFVDFTPTLQPFIDLYQGIRGEFFHTFLNSTIVGLSAAAIATTIGAMAAYALVRFEFKVRLGAGLMFFLLALGGYLLFNATLGLTRPQALLLAFPIALIAAIVANRLPLPGPILGNEDILFWFVSQRMFPPIVTAFALYLLYSEIGRLGFQLIDSFVGLTLCYVAFSLPIVVWLMRDFFEAIPIEVEEAAMVDNVPSWRIFIGIVVPMSMNGLLATFMITLAFVWNEFLFALFLTNSRWQTLPILVAGQNSQRGDEWWAISAAALVAIVPMMIMAGLLSRMMRSGLLLGAIK